MICLLCAACAGPPPDLRLPALDLPRVGTIGWHARDLPPPVVVVNLSRQGRITMDGDLLTLGELRGKLIAIAEASRDEESPTRKSVANLVVRADGHVPWQGVRWVVQMAASPEVRIWRVLYGVRAETGDGEGTLALFLPEDRYCGDPEPVAGRRIRIRLAAEDGRTARPADLSPLARRGGEVAEAQIDADGPVPLATVLATADALLRSGVESITFTGAPGPAGGEPLPSAPDSPQGVSLLLDGVPVPAAPPESPPLAAPARVPGIAGCTGPFLHFEDPIIEDSKRVIEDPRESPK